MLAHLTPKERLGYFVLGAILLFAVGVMGERYLRKPAPIVIEQGQETSKPANEARGSSGVVIHVAGAVKKPGLYHLPPGSRVNDAIASAGGSVDADLDQINLAAHLTDGDQLYVPKVGMSGHSADSTETSRVKPQYRGGPSHSKYTAKKETSPRELASSDGPVDINSADANELERLPGVGPATAKAIIAYRSSIGRFRSVEQLLSVKGIGPKKLEKMRGRVRL